MLEPYWSHTESDVRCFTPSLGLHSCLFASEHRKGSNRLRKVGVHSANRMGKLLPVTEVHSLTLKNPEGLQTSITNREPRLGGKSFLSQACLFSSAGQIQQLAFSQLLLRLQPRSLRHDFDDSSRGKIPAALQPPRPLLLFIHDHPQSRH
jgi:hypothetical protein